MLCLHFNSYLLGGREHVLTWCQPKWQALFHWASLTTKLWNFLMKHMRILWSNKLGPDGISFQLPVDLRITLHYHNPKRDNFSVKSHACVSPLPHLLPSSMLSAALLHPTAWSPPTPPHSVNKWQGTNYEKLLEITNITLRCWPRLKVFETPFWELNFFPLNLTVKWSIDHCFKITGILRSRLNLTVNVILHTCLHSKLLNWLLEILDYFILILVSLASRQHIVGFQ